MMPQMTPRTLRCANAGLYLVFLLIILAATAYVICTRTPGLIETAGLLLLCTAGLLWGGSYILLRYDVDKTGITRWRCGRTRHMAWSNIRRATLRETQQQEVASCTIVLQDETGELTLSSELLPLEDVQALAEELKQRGILQTETPKN